MAESNVCSLIDELLAIVADIGIGEEQKAKTSPTVATQNKEKSEEEQKPKTVVMEPEDVSRDGNTHRLLVLGYIRSIGKEYKIKNFPKEVTDIIHEYEKLVHDKWSKKYSHKDIIINEESISSISWSACDEGTAYGSEVIDHGVFEWRIKILCPLSRIYQVYSAGPLIGIIEDNESVLQRWQDDIEWNECSDGYQYEGIIGNFYTGNSTATNIISHNSECIWFDQNDILTMTLNLDERTLSFKMNDKDWGVAFGNIEQKKYRLALSMYDCKAEFAILHE
eukprot:195826_1